MANDNLTTLTELRELIKIADALEPLSNLVNTALDTLTVFDLNGDPIAEYRYVSALGGYAFIFNGQTYDDN